MHRPCTSSHRARLRAARRLSILAAAVVAAALPATAAASTGDPPPYRPPVDAPVIDPFRPPDAPWGAGNRGLKYGTEPGTVVRAAAGGEVTFAGPVAGTLHVTVLHPDGVRTSYSFLESVSVRIGQRVGQGDPLGRAGPILHLGARLGDTYFDPASLFEGLGPARVRLVPFDAPPGPGLGGERSAISQLVGGAGRILGAGGRVVVGGAVETFGFALHYGSRVGPAAQIRLGIRMLSLTAEAWDVSRRPCTDAEAPIPPLDHRRVAVLVAGLGSTSDHAAIDRLDTAGIGYEADDVVRFSYAGGRVPGSGTELDAGSPRPYDARDSQQDLHRSAVLLADLVEDAVHAGSGAPVDLLAHSQGGLVSRLALGELRRRYGDDWLAEHLGVLVTLGSPHDGANLATALGAARSAPFGHTVAELAALLPAGVDPGSASVAQLSETSGVVAELRATAPTPGVPFTSIAARGDLVVPVPRTDAPGATHVTVGLSGARAHDALPASPAAAREVALAVGGHLPGCTSFGAALADRLTGEVISHAQDHLGALAWFGSTAASSPFAAPPVDLTPAATPLGDQQRRRLPWSAGRTTVRSTPRATTTRAVPRSPVHPDRRWARGSQNRGRSPRGRRHHEATARGRCPLRTPDPPLEPEDEAVHLR